MNTPDQKINVSRNRVRTERDVSDKVRKAGPRIAYLSDTSRSGREAEASSFG